MCYLPEYVNRSKKDKNFYQDKKYLQHVKLEEVETKYSFTEEEDLDWMDMPYEKPEDFAVLKEYYTDYCTKRFAKIKHLFCDALGITYEEIEEFKITMSELSCHDGFLSREEQKNHLDSTMQRPGECCPFIKTFSYFCRVVRF